MKSRKRDSDTLRVWQALKLAAQDARKLADEKGTPFYVVEQGRVVDLNRGKVRRKRRGAA
jgi:hypothetical protein